MVILARKWTVELTAWVESRLEGKFGLEINRDKTRVVEVRPQGGSLDFLGYTFRWDRDRKGRPKKYLNVFPSEKSVARERDKLRQMTGVSQSHTPLPQLVARLNRQLEGWANYFGYGYPRGAWWEIDWFVRGRLIQHLGRRSQRPYRPPKGTGWYEHIQSLGLGLCMPEATSSGEPDAGNPHVRFDEGRGSSDPSYSTGSASYFLPCSLASFTRPLSSFFWTLATSCWSCSLGGLACHSLRELSHWVTASFKFPCLA